MNKSVLIVGAGPTGMVVALQLHRYGVPFRIIEQRTDKCSASKALSVNPASLVMLEDLGVIDELLVKGKKNRLVNLIYNDRQMCQMNFDDIEVNHPYFLMLPQPDTEAVLENKLTSLGYEIERGISLTSFSKQEDEVVVRLTDESGNTEEKTFSYLVGCDGAKSQTREGLGLPFSGYDYDMHFILADVKVEWDRDITQSYYYVKDNGFLIVLPLIEGYHRIVIKVDGGFAEGYQPVLDEFKSHIANLGASSLKISDPIWMSAAPFYNRATSTFQEDNIFIAGDAAHLFSPIGGFGMNTGIGDAFNLGWKLGYSIAGNGSLQLLETYSDERHWNADQLLKQTDLSTSMIARLDRHSHEDERKFLPKPENAPFVKEFTAASAGYRLNYNRSGNNESAQFPLGTLCVAAQLEQYSDKFELGKGKHTLLVSKDLDKNVLITLSSYLDYAFGDCYRIVQLDAPNSVLLQDQFVLVRPDHVVEFVGLRNTLHDLKFLLEYRYCSFGEAV